MNIRVVAGDIAQQFADAIIVNLFEHVTRPGGATGAVDHALGGALTALIASGQCTGKLNEMTLADTFGQLPAKSVIVAGLGAPQSFDLQRVRQVTATSLKFVRGQGFKIVATIVHGAGIGGLSPQAAAQALTEGALMSEYDSRSGTRGTRANGEIEEFVIVEFDSR